MSLQQIVDEIKQLTGEELEELRLELENAQLTRLAEKTARRWAGQTFELRDPVELPQLLSPLAEAMQLHKV